MEARALCKDVTALPAGDETEIGVSGVNLSGGQKLRLALAHTVYAGADVYLLDNPLSAVDAWVANRIFDRVLARCGDAHMNVRRLVCELLGVCVLGRCGDTYVIIRVFMRVCLRMCLRQVWRCVYLCVITSVCFCASICRFVHVC